MCKKGCRTGAIGSFGEGDIEEQGQAVFALHTGGYLHLSLVFQPDGQYIIVAQTQIQPRTHIVFSRLFLLDDNVGIVDSRSHQ